MGATSTATAVLLASELVTNAVQHPYRDRAGFATGIFVQVDRTKYLLRVEVTDEDPRPLPPPATALDPAERGWGLGLVSRLSTDWGSHPVPGDGKVVWFELRLPARG